MTDHMHAEVLRAIGACVPVQWRPSPDEAGCELAWNDWYIVEAPKVNPLTNYQLQWRIAPPRWQENLRQAVLAGKRVMRRYDATNIWFVSPINNDPEAFIFYPGETEQCFKIEPSFKEVLACLHLDCTGALRICDTLEPNVRIVFVDGAFEPFSAGVIRK